MRISIKEKIFLFKFFLVYFVGYLVLEFFLPTFFIQNWLAQFVGNFFGLVISGNIIFTSMGLFVITKDCTGFLSFLLLVSIVFSTKKLNHIHRFIQLFVGFFLLFGINIIRIIFIVQLGLFFGMDVANIVHSLTWFLMAAIILFYWLFTTKKLTNVKNYSELI